MSYYRNFKIIIGTPLWRYFFRQEYKKCVDNLKKLNLSPDFYKNSFTALLCGVGNEVTADEFIKFILAKNKSVDWIETDGFLEYFPKEDLNKLLFVSILKTNWKKHLLNTLLNSFPKKLSFRHLEDFL